MELNLRFPDPGQVVVRYEDDESRALDFASPLTSEHLADIRWYLEVYGAQYTADPDDDRAARIAEALRAFGADLYGAVFEGNDKARRMLDRFLDDEAPGRLLTVSASHPAILSLPWELLRPRDGVFLFDENPRISIRRRLAGLGQGRRPFQVRDKARLHLLFVVSRPEDAGFIDPRTDPQAVLDALEQEELLQANDGRVQTEFLRRATLQALQDRLRDQRKPAVDILHFDGHGVYDPDGNLGEAAGKSHIPDYIQGLIRESATRDADSPAKGGGYLLFEEADGKTALVPARALGELLFRQKVGLVVLSACQSAAIGGETERDAMGSVSAWLTHAGIPNVLAMTHSVLVATTRKLFGRFYGELARGKPVGGALDDARADLYLDPVRGHRQRGEDGAETFTLRLQYWFLPALYQSGRDPALLRADGEPSVEEAAPAPHNLPDLQETGFFGRSRELWAIERAFVAGTRHPAPVAHRLRRPGQDLSGPGGGPLAAAHGHVPALLLRELRPVPGGGPGGRGAQHPGHGAGTQPDRRRGRQPGPAHQPPARLRPPGLPDPG